MIIDQTLPTAAQVTNALKMTLTGRVKSQEASALVDKIAETLREDPNFTSVGSKRRIAIAALVTDLFRVERAGPDKWGSKAMSAGSFTKQYVGFRSFKAVKEAADNVGLIKVIPGWNKRDEPSFDPAGSYRYGAVTRFKAASNLVKLAAEQGITPDNLYDHFDLGGKSLSSPLTPEDLLVVKAQKSTINGQRVGNGTIEISPRDDKANQLRERLRLTNDELLRHKIEGTDFLGLRRIYNDGNCEGFDWQWGGRYYADYVSMPSADRLVALKIDDEKVVEIDIRASHLTILYGITETRYDSSQDPYSIEGVERDVVKSWLTRTFGAGKVKPRWSADLSKDFINSHEGQRLQEVYPIAKVRDAMLEKHPVLKRLNEYDHLALYLQNIEAEIIAKALDYLTRFRKVAALPVHDSLIASISKTRIVTEALALSFRGAVGVVPHLRISQDGEETYSAPQEWFNRME